MQTNRVSLDIISLEREWYGASPCLLGVSFQCFGVLQPQLHYFEKVIHIIRSCQLCDNKSSHRQNKTNLKNHELCIIQDIVAPPRHHEHSPLPGIASPPSTPILLQNDFGRRRHPAGLCALPTTNLSKRITTTILRLVEPNSAVCIEDELRRVGGFVWKPGGMLWGGVRMGLRRLHEER